VLEITNTCQVLPDVSPQRLFDRFYRGDAARTKKEGATASAWSVAQAVTDMHRGQITARYDDEHTIRFTVILRNSLISASTPKNGRQNHDRTSYRCR
jgi:signal transduction histidine kinase